MNKNDLKSSSFDKLKFNFLGESLWVRLSTPAFFLVSAQKPIQEKRAPLQSFSQFRVRKRDLPAGRQVVVEILFIFFLLKK